MNNESQCTMRITDIDVKDIRFPTAQRSYGSDVMASIIFYPLNKSH